ncbi:MAG: hypothetical protein JWN35_1277, partial [Frankiales bacterium]|nr:hypothetical protein [Frankiales bacterium]
PDTATVRPTFLHLLPEALAVASWVGGPRALLTANALLAGFSLLAVFAFGARLVRPVWSLVAMTALAVSLPQLHFSRDTFSEIPAQLLLFAGLTLLYDVTRRRERLRSPLLPGLVAGLVLGASCIARIDAFFYLVPLTVFLTVLAVAGAARLAAGVAGGVLVAAALGYVDLRAASPRYLELQAANLHLIWAALAAVVLAAVATLVWRDRALALWERLPRPALGTAAGGLIVVLGLFAYFARPHLQTAHNIPDGQPTAVEALQQAEGFAVQPGRSYDELSLHWLGWYLGPVALALGILGFALLVRRALRTRDGSLPGLAFLLVFGASSLLYLWKPSIIPVQYWATRRYLPATLPGLLLCAAWLPNISGSWRRLRPPVGVVVAVALLAAPLWFLRGHATDREYVPMLDATARICAALQPDDAVVILGRPPMSTGMPQTIGAFCHVPVAVVSDPTTNRELATAYRAAHAAGRRLVYLSPTPSTSLPDGPVAGSFRQLVDTTVSVEALSLLHRPDGRFTFPFTVWFAAAPPPAA